MLQQPILKMRETSINNESQEIDKSQTSLQAQPHSDKKLGSESKLPSSKQIINIEDDSVNINKKSAFGKGNLGSEKIIIDFNKKEVNLQNKEDQEALIQILKKEIRNKKELQFIDRAVCSLKFFAEKKQQLNEKLYSKLLEKLKYQFLEKEKPLFYHGEKGDQYYIVLKGCLVLLLPPKPFEECAPIDELQQQRLRERYYRLKDPESYLHKQEEDFTPRSPNLQPSNKNRVQTLSKYVNTAFKFCVNPGKPQTPTNSSPKNASMSSPQSRKQSYRGKAPENEQEQSNNQFESIFDLYAQAFFPNFKNAFTFNAGAGFGEIALLRKTERSGTVVSKEDCHLMTLDKESFDEVLGRWEIQKTDEQLSFLKSFAFFKDVNEKYLLGLLHSMKQVTMIRNETIYKEEETPDNVYFIKEGEIELSKLCQIQKSETIQQQLEKEEIDQLIRGNHTSDQQNTQNPLKKNNVTQSDAQPLKKKKSEQQALNNEQPRKERKSNLSGTRVKFAVVSQPCYFGDEEILQEIPYRNHMAKVLSTQAEIWILDRKSFYSLLKQQRTFNKFQGQSKYQINLRNERLQKISSTIKKEEDKFLVSSYKPKKNSKYQLQEHSLVDLIKSKEEENFTKTQEEIDSQVPLTANNQIHNHFVHKEELQFISNEDHLENANQLDSQKLYQYFSRNNYLEQLAQANSKKMKILKEISSKGISGSNVTQTVAFQSSLTEFDDDFTSQNAPQHKVQIPYQKNLLFQLSVGNGIRKGVFRDPFQTYDDQPQMSTKTLKNTSSATNLLMNASDQKRKTLHNLFPSPKQNAIIKPILEKFEKEQFKLGHHNTQRSDIKLENADQKKQNLFYEDYFINRQKQNNSTRLQFASQVNSMSSISHIKEFCEDTKSQFAQTQNNHQTNISSDSLNNLGEKKNKYHNIQELITESKQQLQQINEIEQKVNQKKKLKKMRSDIQFENDYLVNKPENKHKSNQNSTNIVSIQLLHETDEESTSMSLIQSKLHLKPSLHSLAALTPKNNLKPLAEKQTKFEYNERPIQIQSSQQTGKVSRSSFQDQFGQNQKKMISTLNLNASENAFDSFKILMVEEQDQDENKIQYSPTHAVLTSPSHLNKNSSLGSFRITQSNIHMDKLRKQNIQKNFGTIPFIANFNKMKNTVSNKLFKENISSITPSARIQDSLEQKQIITNAFRTKNNQSHLLKKAYQAKK
ncbi:cyclic nucleotide-binding domain protein (macronuclear) [Tetrahymena thermophila SB210]|uniref:Cyclic nucleotide-binding domain protein n=1 Tax=Tetrahymena thermophila (strain SB210) TaxID=312017 RepID=I7MHW2_TETTS|nr:cyclic nucleotide-binding domain protein [Tetrahymena thermophila SB210]EAS03663.2 cyclic nucleotide-binding domain protein [Tetrahymena thermophila SB210]|eukprot:XP_001023908.2 cyclic nucleotide-binding domain protein [Tetrahymena thermophila SB210]